MKSAELRLLKEIKNQFRPVITEAIRDFTFAMIEPKLPSPEHRDFETIIHIYGMKRATQRGAVHVGKKFDDEGNPIVCPMCNTAQGKNVPPSKVSVGDGIRARMKEIKAEIKATADAATAATGKKKQSLENWTKTLQNDLDYLDDALDRYTESGKAEEQVLCPKCTGWQWADIEEYRDPTTGAYQERVAKKHQLPWEMFMDWLWKTLEDAGLNPVQGASDSRAAGFKSEKDKYGSNQPNPNVGPMKHVVLSVEPLGDTVAKINNKLGKILQAGDPTFFEIHRWPDEDMMDRYELAVARSMDKMTPAEVKQADEFEEWLDENRGFYASAKISGSAYGEEIGLPEFEVTDPVDTSKLLQKFKGEKIPLSVGEPPPRGGEWGTYTKSITAPGAKLRAARSSSAHKTHLKTQDKIKDWLEEGVGEEEIRDRLDAEFEENYVARRTKPRDQWDAGEIKRFNTASSRHKKTVETLLAQTKKERAEAVAAKALEKYPGSKYHYWDDEIDRISEVAFGGAVTPVAIELAVSKYFDSLDKFPKPFDFDRLNNDQAVEAINTLKAIDPDEIDSLVRAAEKHLDMPTEAWNLDDLAYTVISDLGSVRANSAYSTLKGMKKKGNNNKLYRESPEFNTKYSKASALFDILLKAAPPLSKVASATPANGSVFDPSCREFWSNIVNEDAVCYDAIASTNARKIGAFYRDKINKMAPWLMESLSKLLNGGSSCEVMTCILDATISGRPLQQSKFDAVRSAAIHYGIRDLVE